MTHTAGDVVRLTNWTAARSGARITITGRSLAGEVMKVAGVDRIETATPFPIATDKNGDRYELA